MFTSWSLDRMESREAIDSESTQSAPRLTDILRMDASARLTFSPLKALCKTEASPLWAADTLSSPSSRRFARWGWFRFRWWCPNHQRRGNGRSLVEKGLRQARKQRWEAVFVLGDPAYYKRLCFRVRRDPQCPVY